MSKHPNTDRALKMYSKFHQLEHRKIVDLHCKMPKQVTCEGAATWTLYESPKWEDKYHGYKHEHEAGVKSHWCLEDGEGPIVNVPGWLQNTDQLTWLGYYLGGEYIDCNGETVELTTAKPYPDLFCTPDGTALVVIDHKPNRVTALIWGGNLNVTALGIVG